MTDTTNKSATPRPTKPHTIIRTFVGVVVSDVMDKTIVVSVATTKVHPKYQKSFAASRRYKVHDEKNQYHAGDAVSFVQCRPLSKDKRWRVLYQ